MAANQTEFACSFPQILLDLAEENSGLVVVSAGPDPGTRAFAGVFPDRFYRVAVADANLVEFAADLAARDFRPIVVGFPWSQTEMLCGNPAPLILVGFDSFRDVSIMRVIPDMTVVIPGDECELRQALEQALAQNGPVYIRVAAGTEPLRFKEEPPGFSIGKLRKLRDGIHVTIAVCGAATAAAIEATSRLASEGVSAELLEIPTIQPIDTEALIRSARKTRGVLTVEEHSVSGGLGSAVAEALCRLYPTGMQMIAAEDGPVSAAKIAQRARAMALALELA